MTPLGSFERPPKDLCLCARFTGSAQLITGHRNGDVVLWDAETFQQLRCMRLHTYYIRDVVVVDGLLVTASNDCTVRFHDYDTWQLDHVLKVDNAATCMRTYGCTLYVGVALHGVLAYNLDERASMYVVEQHDWIRGIFMIGEGTHSIHVLFAAESFVNIVRLFKISLYPVSVLIAGNAVLLNKPMYLYLASFQGTPCRRSAPSTTMHLGSLRCDIYHG